jgi:hypothetical protein
MNIDIIKKDIIHILKKHGAIIVCLILIFLGSVYYVTSNEERLSQANSELMSLEAKIIKKKEEYRQTTKSLKEYQAIEQNKLPTIDGYVLGRDRLREAVSNLEKMRRDYLFKKLNISMSEIKEVPSLKTQSFTVYEGVLTLEFSGATDEYIFSFVNDIKHEFPGFLRLKKMEVRKIAEIDDINAANFFTQNFEGFVSGTIELGWLTLKSNSTEKPAVLDKISNIIPRK